MVAPPSSSWWLRLHDSLAPLAAPARRWRERVQRPLLLAALVAVAAGCAVALDRLDLRWSQIQLLPLLAIALVVVPLSIAYSAVNMMLMGHAARVPMSFAAGVRVSVFAQLAELLPLPGGALVRGAALVRAGGTRTSSAELVIAFSLLWIAFGAAGAGLSLLELGWPALALALGGALAALVVCLWLASRYGAFVALGAAALRLVGVALVAWRFVLAFAVIGVPLAWLDSMAFGFANILGSAAALVPAGLGVTEGLAALIAHPAGVPAAAAFLAATLSRLAGLAVNLLLAGLYVACRRSPEPRMAHG